MRYSAERQYREGASSDRGDGSEQTKNEPFYDPSGTAIPVFIRWCQNLQEKVGKLSGRCQDNVRAAIISHPIKHKTGSIHQLGEGTDRHVRVSD